MFPWLYSELKNGYVQNKIWYERFAEFERNRGTNRIILDRDAKEAYLERFYLINSWMTFGLFRVFIHRFWKSDSDGGYFHSHPWLFWGTKILKGGYIEHTPDKDYVRLPRDKAFKTAWSTHWVELFKDELGREQECWTMFFVFPKIKSWGFKFSKYDKEIPWQTFLRNKLNKSKD